MKQMSNLISVQVYNHRQHMFPTGERNKTFNENGPSLVCGLLYNG